MICSKRIFWKEILNILECIWWTWARGNEKSKNTIKSLRDDTGSVLSQQVTFTYIFIMYYPFQPYTCPFDRTWYNPYKIWESCLSYFNQLQICVMFLYKNGVYQKWHTVLINSILFQRAAVKMANMDTMLDYMFTSPKDANGVSTMSMVLVSVVFWLKLALQFYFTTYMYINTNVSCFLETYTEAFRHFVLRWYLCGAGRFQWVRAVENQGGRQGIRNDLERSLWLQTGRLFCRTSWNVWASLW